MMWGPDTLPNGRSAFPVYRRLGVDVLQRQLQWDRVARSKPANPRDPGDSAYVWPADLDAAVAASSRYRFRVSLLVKGTPDWANGGRGPATVPDRDADYADFLIAAARRYRRVREWMVWGEPTRAGNFLPMPRNKPTGPRRYAKLLDRAYVALKGVRRSNKVIGGNTWTLGEVTPPTFVRFLRLPNGKPPRMDYWGHNPYATRFPDIRLRTYYRGLRDISDIDTLHREIARAYRGRRTPKFWLSEFAVASDRASRGFSFFVSRHNQAKWVTAAYRLAASQRYVVGLGWYELTDETPSGSDTLTNGLLTATGKAKPAYSAYRRVP